MTNVADGARPDLARRFASQAEAAVGRTSPLYTHLLRGCESDVLRGGPVWDLLATRAHEPAGKALPLRLLAAVHYLALDGLLPELGAFYPSRRGHPSEYVWAAFRTVIADHAVDLDRLLDRPVQTNEVGRAKAIVAGLVWLARLTNRPMSMWEIGASAGLNLNWQQYAFFDGGHHVLGPRRSPVALQVPPGLHPQHVTARIHEVVGCDREPIDSNDADGVQWLRACVWADHVDRLELLDAALQVARRSPPHVEAEEATSWLARRLVTASFDELVVVTQSVVSQYLSSAQRNAIATALADAADRRPAGSLARVTVEPPLPSTDVPQALRGLTELRVTLWPRHRDVLLAHIDYHGRQLTLSDTYHQPA